jgi:hypothetical protein
MFGTPDSSTTRSPTPRFPVERLEHQAMAGGQQEFKLVSSRELLTPAQSARPEEFPGVQTSLHHVACAGTAGSDLPIHVLVSRLTATVPACKSWPHRRRHDASMTLNCPQWDSHFCRLEAKEIQAGQRFTSAPQSRDEMLHAATDAASSAFPSTH